MLSIVCKYTDAGMCFSAEGTIEGDAKSWLGRPSEFQPDHQAKVYYLSQLEEEGLALLSDEDVLLPWEMTFQILSDIDHESSVRLLDLPPECPYVPSLSSQGALSDPDFAIYLSGWRTREGTAVRGNVERKGAFVSVDNSGFLLSKPAWSLLEAVKAFASLPPQEKTQYRNEREWGKIRKLAIQAQAHLDNFLERTVTLTPETLRLNMQWVKVGDSRVVEIQPLFADAPGNWLRIFDGYANIQARYDIPTDSGGIAHVIIEPAVKTVLSEIKRMPGRRVAGQRAEAFIRNPYALLGEDTVNVIPPEEFEQSRSDAGISFYSFNHRVVHDNSGLVIGVDLVIETQEAGGIPVSETLRLSSPEQLNEFVRELENKLERNMFCCVWEGYELELKGDARDQLEHLKTVLGTWKTCQDTIQYAEVYDLSLYGGRVEDIGEPQPLYSPFIAKLRDDGGWIPDNVAVGICWTAPGSESPVYLPFDKEMQKLLDDRIEQVRENGNAEINFPGLPQPIQIGEARKLQEQVKIALSDVDQGRRPEILDGKKSRTILLIKPNIENLDYEEKREQALRFDRARTPLLPRSFLKGQIDIGTNREIDLLPHQEVGVAWLQHLWLGAPKYIRGCILADDMGLGKTLQLLVFVARYLEETSNPLPVLIVAPVSLLDNWENEMAKFFKPGFARILTLYGKTLSRFRASVVDPQLQQEGVTGFLKPGWRGDAQIVLTTYETLRDMQFSLAKEKWGILICDETQKIKNPNALVTQAVKAQNATFKIACTGTPVENSLTDLWCLFDFIQPGLLGALNHFGARYRRPIEAKTDEERQAIEKLRGIIEPQILRRTKQKIALNLPPKHDNPDPACKALQLSPLQSSLYSQACNLYKQKREEFDGSAGKYLLSMLHKLREICADPKPYGMRPDLSLSWTDYSRNSPKLKWLLEKLDKVKAQGEKAIIFTEYRDIQMVLQHYIWQRFGFRPVIINGDTSASSEKGQTRQKLIDDFQGQAGFGVIILSTTAIGFGVNIQAANHVIHYTRPWNPAKEDQATDRAYRIGQTKPVYVYCPTIVADDFETFESRLDNLLERKRQLAGDMLNGSDDIKGSEFCDDLPDTNGINIIPSQPIGRDEICLMTGLFFEKFCSILWAKQGYYNVYQTPASGDGGVDIVAIKNDQQGLLIQCKTSSNDLMGFEAIRDVVGGARMYELKHPNIKFERVAVINRRFNDTAIEQARVNEVRLIDQNELLNILQKFPVMSSDVNFA